MEDFASKPFPRSIRSTHHHSLFEPTYFGNQEFSENVQLNSKPK